MKIDIVEDNPIYSYVTPVTNQVIGCLSYDKVWFKDKWVSKTKAIKQKNLYRKKVVNGKGLFPTGLIPRLSKYLKDRDQIVKVDRIDYELSTAPPNLDGITFRQDQLDAIRGMVEMGRGVWKAPTGSGKTIIMAGLISSYYDSRVLVIVHTQSLFHQTMEELKRFWLDVGGIGCGMDEEGEITVAMIQTLNKRNITPDFGKSWGLLIVDEAHHVNKPDGMYGKVLSSILAPARFGLTATLPEEDEGLITMEGLLGPVIGQTTYDELQDCGVLAKPKVKLKYIPENDRYRNMKGKYIEVYEQGVVFNRVRNAMIVDTAFEYIDMCLTVLIMVERIEHGEELLKMCNLKRDGVFSFLHGSTPNEICEEEKELFATKRRRGIIVTRIWSEGTNIKTIGAVINAVGGISEIATLQRFGRGLRSADGKDSVYLVDFFDPNHKWFLRHSGKRVCMYFEQGWL